MGKVKGEMMKAKEILELLAVRHSDAVFVSECKDGPTWGGPHMRLDAWVMKKSWSKPGAIGYEIKVSRSDFFQDDKWPAYLPLCNELYFVCPWGLIQKNETPEACGLLYVTKNGEKLRAVKKAPWRDVDVPEDLYRYILMHRAEIVSGAAHKPVSDREYWEKWLADKKSTLDLGRRVSVKLKACIEERVVAAEKQNEKLFLENQRLQGVKRELEALGVDCGSWFNDRHAARQIQEARAVIPPCLPDDLVALSESLRAIASPSEEE
jgi:hypothetical protein